MSTDRTLTLITELGRVSAELAAVREQVAVLNGDRIPFIAGLTVERVTFGPVDLPVSVEWDDGEPAIVYAWVKGQKFDPADWFDGAVIDQWESTLRESAKADCELPLFQEAA